MTAVEPTGIVEPTTAVPDLKPLPLPPQCCLRCRFYLLPSGLCRRMPPQVVGSAVRGASMGSGAVYEPRSWWQFPQMQPEGWCGEFQQGNLI